MLKVGVLRGIERRVRYREKFVSHRESCVNSERGETLLIEH